MTKVEELEARIAELELAITNHLGVRPGSTSLNTPHANVAYTDKDGHIKDIHYGTLPTSSIPPSVLGVYY